MPVRLRANGTAVALQSVEVRAQITSTVREVHIREGQSVARGDLLFSLDSRAEEANLKKAEAQVEKDRADLANAQRTLERQRQLFEQKFISQSALDAAQNQVETLKGQLAVDLAAVEGTKVALGNTRIHALLRRAHGHHRRAARQPRAAQRHGARHRDADRTPSRSASRSPRRSSPALQRALAAGPVMVEVSPDGGREVLKGRVNFLDNAVDTVTGTIRVKAEFDNRASRLWPGMFVNVMVSPRTLDQASVVPVQAVQTGPEYRFVFVIGRRPQGGAAQGRAGVHRRGHRRGDRDRARHEGGRRGRAEPAPGQPRLPGRARAGHGRRQGGRQGGRRERAGREVRGGIVNFSEPFIRRPVMTVLLSASFVVAGLLAYNEIPIAALPQFDTPTISVSANLPGASPENMASSVATPLEKQFATISGVDVITSSSTLGNTQITLEFDQDRDIDKAAVDVQAALLRAQRSLPVEMTNPPSYRKVNPADAPILFVSLTSPSMALSDLNSFAENLISPTLSTLRGVAQVNINGQKRFAVRVHARPDELAARGLTLDDLASAIRSANANSPVGTLDGPRQTLTIQANRQMTKAAEFASPHRGHAPRRAGGPPARTWPTSRTAWSR